MRQQDSKLYAYVSLTNAAYVELTSVMLLSLIDTGTPFAMRIMCLEDVTTDQKSTLQSLSDQIEICDITTLPLPANVQIPHKAWEISFSRMHMFRLEEFDKLIFLDSDIIVQENIDDLFARPCLSACSHHYPVRHDRVSLNAGVFVLEPDSSLYELILDKVIHLPSPFPPHSWSISDQEVLIALYSPEPLAQKWRREHQITMAQIWHLLDYRYNAIVGLDDRQIQGWDARQAKVLHYTCGPKPWRTMKRDCYTDRLWWKYFEILESKKANLG